MSPGTSSGRPHTRGSQLASCEQADESAGAHQSNARQGAARALIDNNDPTLAGHGTLRPRGALTRRYLGRQVRMELEVLAPLASLSAGLRSLEKMDRLCALFAAVMCLHYHQHHHQPCPTPHGRLFRAEWRVRVA